MRPDRQRPACPLVLVQTQLRSPDAPDRTGDDIDETVKLARELLNVAVTLLSNACALARTGRAAVELDELRAVALKVQALVNAGCDDEEPK